MLPRTARRAGISLIELLVVMAIMAILMSLLMAAVQQVRVKGGETENASRLNQLSAAIGQCKTELKLTYIPSHPVNTTVAPGTPAAPVGFALKRTYAATDPEVPFLQRAFPNIDIANTGFLSPAPSATPLVLDANQTLVFFLYGVGDLAGASQTGFGFSHNPRQPFLPAAAGEKRKGPWIEYNSKWFAPGPGGFPWVVDPYGTPYAYFASIDGIQNNYKIQSFNHPTAGVVQPYKVAASNRWINEKGFQIISAGRDKGFGKGDVNPATGPGEDDFGHFQRTRLGAGLNN